MRGLPATTGGLSDGFGTVIESFTRDGKKHEARYTVARKEEI